VERDEDTWRLTVMMTRTRRRGARLRTWQGARFRALASVWLLLVALPLAASDGPAPGFIGYDWQVVSISYDGTATSIPASPQVVLWFSPGGQFGAKGGVYYSSSGVFRTTRDGFTVSDMGAGGPLAGYTGHDSAVVLAMIAISAFDDEGVHATVKLTGDQLVVGVGPYTLTCQRSGRQADIPVGPPTLGATQATNG
jgi:hypothetical protein